MYSASWSGCGNDLRLRLKGTGVLPQCTATIVVSTAIIKFSYHTTIKNWITSNSDLINTVGNISKESGPSVFVYIILLLRLTAPAANTQDRVVPDVK